MAARLDATIVVSGSVDLSSVLPPGALVVENELWVQGLTTAPREFAGLYEGLPGDDGQCVAISQGVNADIGESSRVGDPIGRAARRRQR